MWRRGELYLHRLISAPIVYLILTGACFQVHGQIRSQTEQAELTIFMQKLAHIISSCEKTDANCVALVRVPFEHLHLIFIPENCLTRIEGRWEGHRVVVFTQVRIPRMCLDSPNWIKIRKSGGIVEIEHG